MPIRCIQCGEADLLPKKVQLPGTIRGETYEVEMSGLECPNCGYKTIEGSAMPEYGRLLADKYRANHRLLTSDEIRRRRRRLGMSQQEFAEHLDVGLASVKRWEMGKIQEPRHNERIIEKTEPRNLQGWNARFPVIHTSTSRYLWPEIELVDRAVPGQHVTHMEHGRTASKQTGAFSRLDLSSPHETISPHLAWLFSQSEG